MAKVRLPNLICYLVIGILLAVLGFNRYHRVQNEQLLEAIRKNDAAGVDRLLARGADPNSFPLIEAIQENESLAVIQALLMRGARVNPPPLKGAPSPLHKALLSRRADILRLLLEKGAHSGPNDTVSPTHLAADYNSPDCYRLLREYGYSATMADAIRYGDRVAVQKLLDQGADVNQKDPSGATPLFLAVSYHQDAIVKLLVARGANVRQVSQYSSLLNAALNAPPQDHNPKQAGAPLPIEKGGPDSFAEAIQTKNIEAVRKLIRNGADVNQIPLGSPFRASSTEKVPQPEQTPLFLAIQARNPPIVHLLLEAGANVHIPLGYGQTFLMVAARTGNQEIVRALVEKGAELDKTDSNRLTAVKYASNSPEVYRVLKEHGAHIDLFDAATIGDAEMIRRLVQQGENPDQATREGYTPLMLAAMGGHIPAMQALLDLGAHIEAVTSQGGATLISAIWAKHADSVRFLLDRGANPNAMYRNQQTAVKYALQNNYPEVYGVLKEHGASIDLFDAATMGDVEMIQRLVRQGADVNRANREGNTPLMLAAVKGQVPAMRVLLDLGAQMEGTTPQGETALMKAIWTKHPDSVRFLLDRGANPNVVHSNGKTVLIRAAEAGNLEILRLLLQKGADVHARSNKGETALKAAEQHGHADAAALLRQFGAKE